MIELKDIGLSFESDGKHVHKIMGVEVPGCTSISGLFPDDGWKFAWPPKLMYEYMWKNFIIADIMKLSVDDAETLYETHLKKAKVAWREKRDKSADTGTLGHSIIEKYITEKMGGAVIPFMGISVDKEINNILEQFLEWEKKYNPIWLASELQVGSKVHGFAGILDAIAEINGKKVLLDFKTSKEIKPEYNIQLAGLSIALEEQGFIAEERAILHLPKSGKYEYKEIKSAFKDEEMDFLVGLAFYKRKNMFRGRYK